jgi:CBS domain-containing protein
MSPDFSLPLETAGSPPELSNEDIYEAMKLIPGYVDITPDDFREIFRLAYKMARQRLARGIPAREIMTREVIAVTPDTPVYQVAEAMGRHGVSGVPVVDAAGEVLGVISEKDFLVRLGVIDPKNFMSVVAECLQVKKCQALPLRNQRAAEVMHTPAVTVTEDTPTTEIARVFHEQRLNRAPVVDAAGRLVGIISRGDVIRATQWKGGS